MHHGDAGEVSLQERMTKQQGVPMPFTLDQIVPWGRSFDEYLKMFSLNQLLAHQASYVWATITSPEHLGRVRMEAMEAFLEDYEQGAVEGRYLPHELPDLPFHDSQFDLCLCSHLLFTYSEHLSADFHERAVLEMCRVAGEVRIFPLLDMSGILSPHVDPVCEGLRRQGYPALPMKSEKATMPATAAALLAIRP